MPPAPVATGALMQRHPEDPDPPWGNACDWPRSESEPESDDSDAEPIWTHDADALRAKRDPLLNEAAAHRAQRWRANRQQGRTSGGRRL